MKKILLNLTGLLIAASLFPQVEIKNVPKSTTVGKAYSGSSFIAELSYAVLPSGDTSYVIVFDNVKYKNDNGLQTISFIASSSDIESLYQALKDIAKTDKALSIKLGETTVTATSAKSKNVTIGTDKGLFTVSEKQLAKLFGKKTSKYIPPDQREHSYY